MSPTSEPSKYNAHVPVVVAPSVVAVNTSKSSSLPETPVTPNAPSVLITSLPSGAKPIASISSAVVDKPTSEPSKYQENVPAVVEPSEVGVNRMISESSTVPKVPTAPSVSTLNRIVPSGIRKKASISLVTPTSDPSKYMDHVLVALLYDRISSSANATLPAVPLVVELRYRISVVTGVLVALGVNVAVLVGVNVGVKVAVLVGVNVAVFVGVNVAVGGTDVLVAVNVAVGGTGVLVAVDVAVKVGSGVFVAVKVAVGVLVGVKVRV